jgi:prepilin-type N-terminal cleavage/methylation domain-containing protein/prepilin-type processing-associated H-X9-DG protein
MNRHTDAKKRRAITLIELLVVIAIIAILAAILFPVFARARENARRASCQSQLKQIGLGLVQYTQDYDERFPSWQMGNTGTIRSWVEVIQPYVKSTQVFICPSEPANKVGTIDGYKTTYSANFFTDGCGVHGTTTGIGVFGDDASVGVHISDIQNAATTISVEEMGTPDDIINPSCPWSSSRLFNGHLATANYLFVDGHVKTLRPFDTVPPKSSVNMWRRDQSNNTGSYLTDQNTLLTNAVTNYQ